MVSIKKKNPDVNIVRGYLTSEKLGEKGMTINYDGWEDEASNI